MAVDIKKYLGNISLDASLAKLEQDLNNQKLDGKKQTLDDIFQVFTKRPLVIADPIKKANLMLHKGVPISSAQAVIEIEKLNRAGKEAIEDDLVGVQLEHWKSKTGNVLPNEQNYVFVGDALTKLLNTTSGRTPETKVSHKQIEGVRAMEKSQANTKMPVQVITGVIDPKADADGILLREFEKLDVSVKNGFQNAKAGIYAIQYLYNNNEYLIYAKVEYVNSKYDPSVGKIVGRAFALSLEASKKNIHDPSVPEYKELGHIIGDSGRKTLENTVIAKAYLAKLRAQRFSKTYTTEPEGDRQRATAAKFSNMLDMLEEAVDADAAAAIQHDLLFVNSNIRGSQDDAGALYDSILDEARKSGAVRALILGKFGPAGNLSAEPVESVLEWNIFVSNPAESAAWNGWRGTIAGDQEKKASSYRGSKELYKKLQTSTERLVRAIAEVIVDESFSSSMLTEASLKALAKILMPIIGPSESKKILKAIKKRSTKVIFKKDVTIQQPKITRYNIIDQAHKILRSRHEDYANEVRVLHKKFKQAETKRQNRLRARARQAARSGNVEIGYNNIINTMNQQIRQAVIEQMGPSSLMNRTGRFASSVKITRASEKSLNFIYERNPYGVFRTQGGDERVNHPRARDPGVIIRKAINALAQKNFQEFFRDRLYIRED